MDSKINELYEFGMALFQNGKYSEAEPIFRDILKINPNYADVLNKLGIITHLKGNTKEASEYFERALELNPKYTEASLNLAIAYNDMGEFKKAQEVFQSSADSSSDPDISGLVRSRETGKRTL